MLMMPSKSFIFNGLRKRGFEPLRYCYRQPLKLVRLPVPPLPLTRADRIFQPYRLVRVPNVTGTALFVAASQTGQHWTTDPRKRLRFSIWQ